MSVPRRPATVNIMGVAYKVLYVDNPAEVDRNKRVSLWGSLDYWTKTIRIYDNSMPSEEVWNSLLHEILHAIGFALHLDSFNEDENHDELDILALALMDVFCRNGWLEIEE